MNGAPEVLEPRREAPRRLRLEVWLTLMTSGLVVLVLVGLVPAGLSLLHQLADESASSRVRLAALGAAEGLERHADEGLTHARILAERPTLLRMTANGDAAGLAEFLRQFRSTTGIDGCAVVVAGAVLASSPPDLDWSDLTRRAPAELSYLEPPSAGSPPRVIASADVVGIAAARTLVVRRLGPELEQALAEQVGLPLRLSVAPAAAARTFESDDGSWIARQPVALRPADQGRALAAQVEVELPAEVAEASLKPLQRAFAWISVVASAIAVTVGILAARRLARPLGDLRKSAQRIASGDLTTPVAPASGAEAGSLAATMETMRQRLRSVTTELRNREAEASALVESIDEGVFAVDSERRIQYLNPQAASRLGTSIDEALGRFCGDVLRAVDREGKRPCDDNCPIVHARSRGSTRSVEFLDLPGGRRTVVIASARPVGERQVQLLRDETGIEAARRSRDAVLANVSHELKTPLSAQLASIELLRDAIEARLSPPDLELVASLERSTLRLKRLIDNLLESVSIETGRASSRRVPIDVGSIVADAAAMTEPLLGQRRQELVLEIAPSLPSVLGDPVQLTQVLVNLLSNANKFAPAGSTITVGAAALDGEVSLWVEDSGPGIPPVEARSVFDHYHRVDPGTAEGMGLGLGIVKSIVERHRGRVAVGPSAHGGARFTVTIPVEAGP